MSIATMIKTVAPAGAATKWVESRLDCSPRQAKRIVSEGLIPRRYYEAIISALMREVERSRKQLDDIDGQLQEIQYERICATAEARRSRRMDAAAAVGDRRAARAEASLPLMGITK